MVEILKSDITDLAVDAIVNPANSLAVMGGGLSLAIKQKGGQEIEQEAMMFAPIMIGNAIVTRAGRLKCKMVIHAPTVEQPGGKSSFDNVKRATDAALQRASYMRIHTVALPAMGAGSGGVPKAEAAKAMLEAIKKFRILKITLVAHDDEMYQIFQRIFNPPAEPAPPQAAQQ